jgi:hypothetical protein
MLEIVKDTQKSFMNIVLNQDKNFSESKVKAKNHIKTIIL